MNPFDDFFTESFFIENDARNAMQEKNYNKFYAVLKKMEGTFRAEEAYDLCNLIILQEGTEKAFRAALEHCPPLEEFCYYGKHQFYRGKRLGLTEQAIVHDRNDILQILLEHGASPNRRDEEYYSPLEAAAASQSIFCLELLLEHPDIDVEITEELLDIWAHYGSGVFLDLCLDGIAEKSFGYRPKEIMDMPVPKEMTIGRALKFHNWRMIKKIIKKEGLTQKEGKEIAKELLSGQWKEEWIEILDAMFEACPNLLRCDIPRYLLVYAILKGEEVVDPRLKKWMQQMPGHYIILPGMRWKEQMSEGFRYGEWSQEFLFSKWGDRIDGRFVPALNRNDWVVMEEWYFVDRGKALRWLLDICQVTGNRSTKWISMLAKQVLETVSMETLVEMLQSGCFLLEENVERMMDHCSNAGLYLQRAALAAYAKKEVSYEL